MSNPAILVAHLADDLDYDDGGAGGSFTANGTDARFASGRLLLEPATTNYVRNPRFVGMASWSSTTPTMR